jgi:hypothetical protein
MSCIAINSGISLDCGANMGGVTKLWLTDFDNVGDFLINPDEDFIEGIGMENGFFYEFQFNKNSAVFTENLQVDLEAGSSFYNQELSFKIGKRELTKRNILKLLVRRKLIAIAKDANGILWVLGQKEGLFLTELNSSSGQAKADGSFYEFKLTGEEIEPSRTISETLVTEYVEIVDENFNNIQ